MKILILTNSSSGLYDFRNELLQKLLVDHEIVISLPDDVKIEELQEEGCRIVHTPINRRGMNPVEDFKLFMNYRRLLKAEKPDLVLTYTIKPNVYGGFCCRLFKVPYMTTITGLGSMFYRNKFVLGLVKTMYAIAMKNASCVFFQNRENRAIFERYHIHGKRERLVQGSGVNLEKHPIEEYPQKEEVNFLFIGRVMREKGIDEFLEAAKILHSDNVLFEILGFCDERYETQLNEYEEQGIIKQLGFHKNVHPFIKDASVVVMPSHHEGMSNVLLEASATGRPIIASRISGCIEIMEEGVTGIGCEQKNVESLVGAMKQFLTLSVEERAEMGRKAHDKVAREFDRNMVVDVYIEEIYAVLNQK